MSTTTQRFPFARLLVIAGAIFVSVSSEFLPTAILPEIAAGLRVTEAQAGLLVTGFAITVVVTTAPLTALTSRLDRKWLLVGTLGIFAATNVLAGLADTYWLLLTARIIGGVAHGVFWAVTAPYAARLVKPSQVVRATSVTQAGGTLAFILGVPMGAVIGHAVGWRMSFIVMAILIVAFAILAALFLPPVDHRVRLATGEVPVVLRKDPSLPIMFMLCGAILLAILGNNSFSTYIAPWLIGVVGVEEGAVASVLFISGICGAFGLVIAGLVGDTHPYRALYVSIGAVVVAMVGMALIGPSGWIVLVPFVIWSVGFSVFPPLVQGLMMREVSPRLRDMAAATMTTAFNTGIGVGALVGAGVISVLSLDVLPWFAGAILFLALIPVIAARRWTKRAPTARARRAA